MATSRDDERELWERLRPPNAGADELARDYAAFLDGNSSADALLAKDAEIAHILAESRLATPTAAMAEPIIAAQRDRVQLARRVRRGHSWMALAASVTLAAGMGLWVGQVASDRTKQKQNTRPLALWVADADGLDGLVALEEYEP